MIFIIYLTPCIPLSFKGEGELNRKRGFHPSWTPLLKSSKISYKVGGKVRNHPVPVSLLSGSDSSINEQPEVLE